MTIPMTTIPLTLPIIIAALFVLLMIGVGLKFLDDHCEDEFGYRFLTIPLLAGSGIACALFLWGMIMFENSTLNVGYEGWIGISMAVLGGIIYIGIVINNIIETDFLYGSFGSLIQLPILTVGAYLALVLAMGIGLILMMFAAMGNDD